MKLKDLLEVIDEDEEICVHVRSKYETGELTFDETVLTVFTAGGVIHVLVKEDD